MGGNQVIGFKSSRTADGAGAAFAGIFVGVVVIARFIA
jgi:hypothetical protein